MIYSCSMSPIALLFSARKIINANEKFNTFPFIRRQVLSSQEGRRTALDTDQALSLPTHQLHSSRKVEMLLNLPSRYAWKVSHPMRPMSPANISQLRMLLQLNTTWMIKVKVKSRLDCQAWKLSPLSASALGSSCQSRTHTGRSRSCARI